MTAIEWNEEAFDRLVLPGDYKELVRGSVEKYVHGHRTFDDITKGKGCGMVFLPAGKAHCNFLSTMFTLVNKGSPGVGKTLTAETSTLMPTPIPIGARQLIIILVSEKLKKPLHYVRAGSLRYSSEEVEANLRYVFELAKRWGSILLLDEAVNIPKGFYI